MKFKLSKMMAKALAFTLMAVLVFPAITVSAAPAADIGLEEAKAIAYANSQADGTTITLISANEDYDGGAKEYEIKFSSGNTIFKYEINAQDGAVKKMGFDISKQSLPWLSFADAEAKETIKNEQVQGIVLNHLGIKADSISGYRAEREYDDGILKYDVDFIYNGVEYSYDINTTDGAIISYEMDADNDADDAWDDWDDAWDDHDDHDDWDDHDDDDWDDHDDHDDWDDHDDHDDDDDDHDDDDHDDHDDHDDD